MKLNDVTLRLAALHEQKINPLESKIPIRHRSPFGALTISHTC